MKIQWALFGQIQVGRNSRRDKAALAVGAKVQFYSGTGTTPLTTYTDADESVPHTTGSLVTDANGRWPEVHIPFGTYNYRILDSDDTIITTIDEIPNPEPTDVSDATDTLLLLKTGMMIFMPAARTQDGFVRANGRTIGPAGSGGTERGKR